MERHQLNKAYARLHHLAYSTPDGKVADVLQDRVEELVRDGYPQDALYEDLKRLVLEMQRDDRDDLEDAVLDVMDVLVGWCAPSARL